MTLLEFSWIGSLVMIVIFVVFAIIKAASEKQKTTNRTTRGARALKQRLPELYSSPSPDVSSRSYESTSRDLNNNGIDDDLEASMLAKATPIRRGSKAERDFSERNDYSRSSRSKAQQAESRRRDDEREAELAQHRHVHFNATADGIRENAKQAFIFSEIFGRPRSQRRHSPSSRS